MNSATKPFVEYVVIKSRKSKPSHVEDDSGTVWKPRMRKTSLFMCVQKKRPCERRDGQDMRFNNTCAPAAFDSRASTTVDGLPQSLTFLRDYKASLSWPCFRSVQYSFVSTKSLSCFCRRWTCDWRWVNRKHNHTPNTM